MNRHKVYQISDSTGETLDRIFLALKAQFDNFEYEKVISRIIDSMHALVWYNKSTNEIILSRDHAGIKPLYYAFVKSGIIFCSEIKGLLSSVNDSNKINRESLACTSILGINVLKRI